MRLAWVKAGKILPVDTGGKIRSYNILRYLSERHEVKLLSYYPGARDASYEGLLQEDFPGAHAVAIGGLDGDDAIRPLEYLRHFVRRAPYAVSKFTHPEVQRTIASWMREARIEILFCDFLAASMNFPDDLSTPIVLFQHNVETKLWQRRALTESSTAKRIFYRIEAAKMANCERRALRKFHHIIAVSNNDRREMLEMEPASDVSVVPTGVDTRRYVAAPPARDDPPKIVFTGSMDWEPNIDAVTYFCSEILPLIKQALPSAVFQIVGRTPHPRVRRLASSSVQVTGTVPSVEDYLREATVVVVPLRAGGGTRLKIFEAMA